MIAFNLQSWSQWLDDNAKEQYAKAGYYSQPLRLTNGTLYQNTKIIAVTTQPCYQYNLYLWGERNDPGQVLQWLEDELRQMEKDGQIGIIIAHVPPGANACLY